MKMENLRDCRRQIRITISKDGAVSAEASGFEGATCEEATKFLNDLFEIDTVEHKACYYNEHIIIADPLPSGFCG